MNPSEDLPVHFNQLVDGFIADSLTDDSHRQLEELLRDNVSAQKFFLKYCQLHIDLLIDTRAECVGSEVSKSPAPIVFGGLENALHWPWIVGSVLSVLTICAVALWQINSPSPQPLRPDGPPVASSRPFDKQMLRLRSGTAELELPGVGNIIVEGPAEFNLLDPMHARLEKGRMRMHVTEESGRGFVVETPCGKVTDLGTAFGLHVAGPSKAGLVVFEGAVDLALPRPAPAVNEESVHRLVGGEGVVFGAGGRLERITAIRTNLMETFYAYGGLLGDGADVNSVIVDVSDNLRTRDTKKFYEIVPGGFQEDVRSYVDRKHEWNTMTRAGKLPSFLVGADYVKTFNEDRERVDMEINVTLSRPAKLYVLMDARAAIPAWMTRAGFNDTGHHTGIDMVDSGHPKGKGRGDKTDHRFEIWVLDVLEPGTITLGPNGQNKIKTGPGSIEMYGIAAVATESAETGESKENGK